MRLQDIGKFGGFLLGMLCTCLISSAETNVKDKQSRNLLNADSSGIQGITCLIDPNIKGCFRRNSHDILQQISDVMNRQKPFHDDSKGFLNSKGNPDDFGKTALKIADRLRNDDQEISQSSVDNAFISISKYLLKNALKKRDDMAFKQRQLCRPEWTRSECHAYYHVMLYRRPFIA